MTLPLDPTAETFLRLVDLLDAEANAVAHAVVRAQTAARSMADDSRALLERQIDDRRTLAEVGVRLIQHRATLVEALNSLCPTTAASNIGQPAPVTAIGFPVPPRPIRRPPAVERPAGMARGAGRAPSATIEMPVPPEARYHPPQPKTA